MRLWGGFLFEFPGIGTLCLARFAGCMHEVVADALDSQGGNSLVFCILLGQLLFLAGRLQGQRNLLCRFACVIFGCFF